MIYKKVAEFHRAFDILIADRPTLPDADTRALRMKLLDEEHKEILEADSRNHLVDIASELADLIYIACGTSVTYGIVPFAAQNTVLFTDPTFSRPLLPHEACRAYWRDRLNLAYAACIDAENTNDLGLIAHTLGDIITVAFNMASTHGLPLVSVFNAIHDANMKKLGPDGKPIRRADGKVIKPEGWQRADIASVLARFGYQA